MGWVPRMVRHFQPAQKCHPFPGTQASLCVNELARKKSTIDFAEVPQETWEQIVRSCVQIMPMLPGSRDVALPVGLHVLLRYGYTIGVSIYQPISPIYWRPQNGPPQSPAKPSYFGTKFHHQIPIRNP